MLAGDRVRGAVLRDAQARDPGRKLVDLGRLDRQQIFHIDLYRPSADRRQVQIALIHPVEAGADQRERREVRDRHHHEAAGHHAITFQRDPDKRRLAAQPVDLDRAVDVIAGEGINIGSAARYPAVGRR